MKIKAKRMRVDNELAEFIKKIQMDMARQGKIVSERRVSAAIPRVQGLREELLNSEWKEEQIRKGRKPRR